MPKVRVSCYSLSLDGFGAGPDQSLDNPMGRGGMAIHGWILNSSSFGGPGGSAVDDDFMTYGMGGLGAWIMGRNMFGPVRGPWTDDDWKGWWGAEPPYHCDVFVLTHHARMPIEMAGGTVFHFVTEGIEAALERAKASAGEKDIRIGGGASTVRQYLEAGLIDEMHLAVAPALLGSGEPLLSGIDLAALGLTKVAYTPSERAAHYVISRADT